MPEPRRAAMVVDGAVLALALALPFSIAGAQLALTVAVLAWLGGGAPVASWALLRPALAFAALTLASAALSADPWLALVDCKELLQFAILAVVPAAAATVRARALAVLIAAAAASASWGAVEYLASRGGLLYRADGPFGHYMTFAGVLMLALVAAAAAALSTRPGRRLALAAVPVIGLGLLVSYARNAWLGTAAGVAVALAMCRPRYLIVLAAAALTGLLLLPTSMHERLASAFDPDANRDRLEMLAAGADIVRAQPLLGVGSGQVQDQLKLLDSTGRLPAHVHNNPLQIAAERGLPALAAWLWLLVAIGLCGWRARCARPGDPAGVTALGALCALSLAGLFEYNFGDSEVKMTFLLLATLADAVAYNPGEATCPPP